MTTYDQKPCNFKFKIAAIEKIVDGDTIDALIDLGFDVMSRQRVRLLGIDTPESRTSNEVEKVYGNLSKKKLAYWCTKAVASEKDDIEIELRCPEMDSRGKFGRVLGEIWVSDAGNWTNVNQWMCENGHAVPYTGQNKNDVQELHMANRRMLAERGEQELLQ